MTPAVDLAQFVQETSNAKSINALADLVGQATRKLGFDYFAFVHLRVDLYEHRPNLVFVYDFPAEWAATMYVRKYMTDDPVIEICLRQQAPFLWSDMPSLVDMSPRQREMQREARRAGLLNGFTVPIHIPDEPVGCCSFATTGEIPHAALGAMTSVAIIGFDAARRLVRRDVVPTMPRLARLTRPERDCVMLAGRGLGAAKTAQLLGIAETGVASHIASAQRKYGVTSVTELVVRALYRSELSYEDLIDVASEPSGKSVSRRSIAEDEPAPMARLGALFFGTNPNLN